MDGFDIDGTGALVNCWLDDETVVIPEGVNRIRSHAFDVPRHIRRLVIPWSVERIDSWGLVFLQKLEELELHEGLRWIGGYFLDSKCLKTVRFPASLRGIMHSAFVNTGVQEFIFPDGLETGELFLDEHSLFPDQGIPNWLEAGNPFLGENSLTPKVRSTDPVRIVWPYGPESIRAGLDTCTTQERWVYSITLEAGHLDPHSLPAFMKTAFVRGFVSRMKDGKRPTEGPFLEYCWDLVQRFIFKDSVFRYFLPEYGEKGRWPDTPSIRDCALCLIRYGRQYMTRQTADRILLDFRNDFELRAGVLEAVRGMDPPACSL